MNNIPRIGDKIVDGKLVKSNPDVLPVELHAQESVENSVSDDKVSVQQETTESVQEPEQKEYSLEQFRKDYKHILRREVFSQLKPFERERKRTYKLLINLGIPVAVLLTILCAVFCAKNNDFRAIIIPFLSYVALWQFLKKKLENKIKVQVMPILMRAVPNFEWSLNESISRNEVEQTDLIPALSGSRYSSDDNFRGKYRDVEVSISEQKYLKGSGKNERTIYQGAVIKIHMNKNFESITLIRPKGEKKTKDKLEEVNLEDVEFRKKYQVFSNNQIEARYLLTTSFMERFQNIKTAYDASKIYGAFYDKYFYIAPYTNEDLFSLAHLSKTLIDEEQYDVLFKQFSSILALVDYFKLDKKLGL